jgi:hypothetical protein
MDCLRCGNRTSVENTMGTAVVFRTRKCRTCNYKFDTEEKPLPARPRASDQELDEIILTTNEHALQTKVGHVFEVEGGRRYMLTAGGWRRWLGVDNMGRDRLK